MQIQQELRHCLFCTKEIEHTMELTGLKYEKRKFCDIKCRNMYRRKFGDYGP